MLCVYDNVWVVKMRDLCKSVRPTQKKGACKVATVNCTGYCYPASPVFFSMKKGKLSLNKQQNLVATRKCRVVVVLALVTLHFVLLLSRLSWENLPHKKKGGGRACSEPGKMQGTGGVHTSSLPIRPLFLISRCKHDPFDARTQL